ncbi:MAG: hypothetical protein ACRDHP_18365 [Ktedonobacterales bacterium]
MIDLTETPTRKLPRAPRTVQRARAWQRPLGWIRRHGLALGVVLLACVIGQAITLSQVPRIIVDHDGPSYLLVAHTILTHHQFLSAARTPGYPALLAMIFSITGESNLGAVTMVQAALVVLASLEIYLQVYLLTRRRWVACALASLVGANLYILDWERLVRDETLSFFLLVTLFLVLTLYLRTERTSFLLALTVLFLAAVSVRPSLALLPGILLVLLALRSLRLAQWRMRWRALALSLILTYGIVGGYMAVNAATFGFFGLTNVVSVDTLGKVLEYRMQGESGSAQYAQLRADANQYVRTVSVPGSTGPLNPWTFVNGAWRTPPNYEYARDNYNLVGAYSRDLMLHHPVQYVLDSIPDVLAGWTASPTVFYAPYSATPTWIYRLLELSRTELLTYLLLPLALVLLTVLVWRAPKEDGAFVLWVMMIAATTMVIIDGFASYVEYYRLREPLDWTLLVAVGILVIDALALGFEKVRPALVEQWHDWRFAR